MSLLKIIPTQRALNFDRVNDALLSVPLSPDIGWERDQPWTAYFNCFPSTIIGTIFNSYGSIVRGLDIRLAITSTGLVLVNILLVSGIGNNISINTSIQANRKESVFQITYDGSSLASGFNFYVDNIEITDKTIISDTLTNTTLSTRVTVGARYINNSTQSFFGGYIKNLSLVDYVKNSTEREEDFNIGFQTSGTGNYLFNMDLTYPDGGVKTLNSSTRILETSQNIEYAILGKSTLLQLDVDLVLTEQPKILKSQSKKSVLYLDGINDYLVSDNTFEQWERDVPFTAYFHLNHETKNRTVLFDTRETTSGRGIVFFVFDDNNFGVQFTSTISSNFLQVLCPMGSAGKKIIQITYDGSSSGSGLQIYINNELQTISITNNTLSGSITGMDNFRIGFKTLSVSTLGHYRGQIIHFSIVDYIKSSTELNVDFLADKQSLGSGSWLIEPIEPTYNQNNLGQITTLDSTVPLATNPPLTILGKTPTLTLGTDLIELESSDKVLRRII